MGIEELISGLLNVGTGGLLGLAGSVLGLFAKFWQEKQRQAWETKKWAHESELFELQMKQSAQETEQELAIVSSQGSWAGLSESIQAAGAIQNVHKWVNDARALFRLALTILLWVLAGLVFYKIMNGDLIGLFKSQEQLKELMTYMVHTVFFCASAATMWWFGDRALSPPGGKNR